MKVKKGIVMKTAHVYKWQESAVHGIRAAVADCGFKANPEKPLYGPKKGEKFKKCPKCLAANKKERK